MRDLGRPRPRPRAATSEVRRRLGFLRNGPHEVGTCHVSRVAPPRARRARWRRPPRPRPPTRERLRICRPLVRRRARPSEEFLRSNAFAEVARALRVSHRDDLRAALDAHRLAAAASLGAAVARQPRSRSPRSTRDDQSLRAYLGRGGRRDADALCAPAAGSPPRRSSSTARCWRPLRRRGRASPTRR